MDSGQQFQTADGQLLATLEVELVDGNPVIFWDEITLNFGENIRLLNGHVSVPFLRDRNRVILEPRRIKFYEKSILIVKEHEGSTSSLFSSSRTPPQSSSPASHSSSELDDVVGDLAITESPPSSSSCKHSSSRPASSRSLVRHSSQAIIDGTGDIISQFSDLGHTLVHEIRSGNASADAATQQLRKIVLEQKETIQKNYQLSEKLAMNDQELLHVQTQMQKHQADFLETVRRIEQKQDEAIAHIRKLNEKVQALMNMTFELFEYQVPRLFIVLPDNLDPWADWNPLTNKFRLYFLCECGEHTKPPPNRTTSMPNHIHLAKHEGYPIVRPTEFFQQYGPYLLTVLEMVHKGIAVAGAVVPAMKDLGILRGVETIQDGLNFTKDKFTPLLEKSIEFTQGKLSLPGVDTGENESMMDQEALEGADLRQLASFLSGADEAKTLANLYRMVTKEGHVKWVCLDHFNVNYNIGASEKLKELVREMGGVADDSKGHIQVVLKDEDAAGSFYSALHQAKYFISLHIAFDWEVTRNELTSFYRAIIESNIRELHVCGEGLQKQPMDLYYKTRFDPFVKLMATGQLHSFTIDNCPTFLKRVGSFGTLASNTSGGAGIKSLKLNDSWNPQLTRAQPETIAKLVNSFPKLVDLQMHSVQDEDVHNALNALSDTFKEHQAIRTVTFDGSVFEVVDGTVSLVSAVFPTDLARPYWTSRRVRRLTVREFPDTLMKTIQQIMLDNTELTEVTVCTTGQNLYRDILRFQALMHSVYHPVKVTFVNEKDVTAVIIYNGQNVSDPEKQQQEQLRGPTMDFQYWNLVGSNNGTDQYQPCHDADFEILDRVTRQIPGSVTTLHLDVTLLSEAGLASLGRVLKQSGGLDLLSINATYVTPKAVAGVIAAMENLNFANTMKLYLHGSFVAQWIKELDEALTRWNSKRQQGVQYQQQQESRRWHTFSIEATDPQPAELAMIRALNLGRMIKILPPRHLELKNLTMAAFDWEKLLKAVYESSCSGGGGGLERLNLQRSVNYTKRALEPFYDPKSYSQPRIEM
ncbi:hypothetical protein BG004_004496 [Podila humilis]|nr:hypothetical protein BG004_004496 [Podila humilis]